MTIGMRSTTGSVARRTSWGTLTVARVLAGGKIGKKERQDCCGSSGALDRHGIRAGCTSRVHGVAPRRSRLSTHVRERAIRVLVEHASDHASRWATITSNASTFGSLGAARVRRAGGADVPPKKASLSSTDACRTNPLSVMADVSAKRASISEPGLSVFGSAQPVSKNSDRATACRMYSRAAMFCAR